MLQETDPKECDLDILVLGAAAAGRAEQKTTTTRHAALNNVRCNYWLGFDPMNSITNCLG